MSYTPRMAKQIFLQEPTRAKQLTRMLNTFLRINIPVAIGIEVNKHNHSVHYSATCLLLESHLLHQKIVTERQCHRKISLPIDHHSQLKSANAIRHALSHPRLGRDTPKSILEYKY